MSFTIYTHDSWGEGPGRRLPLAGGGARGVWRSVCGSLVCPRRHCEGDRIGGERSLGRAPPARLVCLPAAMSRTGSARSCLGLRLPFLLQLPAQAAEAMGRAVVLNHPKDGHQQQGIPQGGQGQQQAEGRAPGWREIGRCWPGSSQAQGLGAADEGLLLRWQKSHGLGHPTEPLSCG